MEYLFVIPEIKVSLAISIEGREPLKISGCTHVIWSDVISNRLSFKDTDGKQVFIVGNFTFMAAEE
jgi:hypothetical protein